MLSTLLTRSSPDVQAMDGIADGSLWRSCQLPDDWMVQPRTDKRQAAETPYPFDGSPRRLSRTTRGGEKTGAARSAHYL